MRWLRRRGRWLVPGRLPVSATNCLNFGNPEKPEIMAQLSQAIDGIAEACIALGTPVTGGNVSLYNETKGEGIYPTPVIGIVGIIEDVTKAVPSAFRQAGDKVLFLSASQGAGRNTRRELGSSEYAKTMLHELWGTPPVLDLTEEAALHKALVALAEHGLLASATDISDGGPAVAFAKACFPRRVGFERVDDRVARRNRSLEGRFFSEIGSSVIVSTDEDHLEAIRTVLAEHPKVWMAPLGEVTEGNFEISINGTKVVDEPILALKGSWAGALEEQLADEVVTA